MPTVTISHRFCGPPTSGHGGYTAGLLAGFLDTPATVTLKAPPPLDTPLDVVTQYYGGVELVGPPGADGTPGIVCAVAERRAPLAVDEPKPVGYDVAGESEEGFIWRTAHPWPSCFACGTARDRGDAWRTAGGPTPDGRHVASRAICPPDLVSPDGTIPVEQIWVALDCITSAPLGLVGASWEPPWVLGQLGVDVLAKVRADDELVLMAWPDDDGLDGRKLFSAGALYANGRTVAVARATWVQLRATPPT